MPALSNIFELDKTVGVVEQLACQVLIVQNLPVTTHYELVLCNTTKVRIVLFCGNDNLVIVKDSHWLWAVYAKNLMNNQCSVVSLEQNCTVLC